MQEKIEKARQGESKEFNIQDDTLIMGSRICVPDIDNLHREILEEAHNAPYAMHPGMTKMYNTLRPYYWWPRMKRDVAKYVSKCLTCQQVKVEHQAPVGKLKPLAIPEWKRERITMDFVCAFPKTPRKKDVIWVIIN